MLFPSLFFKLFLNGGSIKSQSCGTPSENFPYSCPWSFGKCQFKDGSCCKLGHVHEKLSGFSVHKNENLSGLHLGINLMYCIL